MRRGLPGKFPPALFRIVVRLFSPLFQELVALFFVHCNNGHKYLKKLMLIPKSGADNTCSAIVFSLLFTMAAGVLVQCSTLPFILAYPKPALLAQSR